MTIAGIMPNLEKDEDLSVTKRLITFLENKGCCPYIPCDIAKNFNLDKYGIDEDRLFSIADFIIVLGGDGTLLGIGRRTAKYNTPLLGINLGNLGFLTAADNLGAEYAIEKVLENDYKVEKRLMIEAYINKGDNINNDGIIALNDICITRGAFSKLVEIDVYANKEYLDTVRADGIIISTPTGSTAYNLSAGGPILKPDTKIMAITPICPHNLYSRSIVISADDVITMVMRSKSNDSEFLLSADGQDAIKMKNNDIVRIKKSQFYTTIIKTEMKSFYDILREKLSGNGG